MHFKALKKKKKAGLWAKRSSNGSYTEPVWEIRREGKSIRGSSPIWDEELSLKEKILKLRN